MVQALGRRRTAELGGSFFFQEEIPDQLPQFQILYAFDEFRQLRPEDVNALGCGRQIIFDGDFGFFCWPNAFDGNLVLLAVLADLAFDFDEIVWVDSGCDTDVLPDLAIKGAGAVAEYQVNIR